MFDRLLILYCCIGVSDEERMKQMVTKNPCYVLRNWMAHEAIKKADNGDYSEVGL